MVRRLHRVLVQGEDVMTTRSASTAFAIITGTGIVLAYIGLLDHAYVAPSAPDYRLGGTITTCR